MNRPLVIALALAAIIAGLSPACAAEDKQASPYPGDITYVSTGEAVVFSHKAHAGDFGLECAECHGSIFAVNTFAASKKGDFDMESIYNGKYCGVCHNGTKAFASDDFAQCARCHTGPGPDERGEALKKVAGPKDAIDLGSGDSVAEFRHPVHGSLKCSECHTKIFPMRKTAEVTTMDEINAKKSCGSCHNGEAAFDASDCGKCHPKM